MTVYWWCSFCDPIRPAGSQFLGLLILPMPADHLVAMLAKAAVRGGLP